MNLFVRSTNVRLIFLFVLFLMPFVLKSQQRALKPEVLYERALAYLEATDPYTGEKLPSANFAEAARLLHQAAVQDFGIAQRTLGDLYRTGRGVPEDKREAVRWLTLAAEKGDAVAQMHLGVIYDSGEGVDVNEREAFKWFRKAAERGEVKAQLALATMYGGGHGTVQDTGEAMTWYRKAADQGSAMAQYALGVAYEEGFDGVRSRKDAIGWYRKAAAQGMIEAKLALSRFANPVEVPPEEASENLIGAIVPQNVRALQESGVSGSVSLRIIVDRKGYVSDVTYLSGQEELKDIAMLTASELRYKPFLREGKPVEGITTVSVKF